MDFRGQRGQTVEDQGQGGGETALLRVFKVPSQLLVTRFRVRRLCQILLKLLLVVTLSLRHHKRYIRWLLLFLGCLNLDLLDRL